MWVTSIGNHVAVGGVSQNEGVLVVPVGLNMVFGYTQICQRRENLLAQINFAGLCPQANM